MAKAAGTEVLTPIGKLVQGSTFELSERKDDKGNVVLGEDGKPQMQCYFAIAIDKANPEWPAFWNLLVQTAASGYPQYFQQGRMPGLKEFAYKVTDGDGFDKYGKPNAEKPGFAGCWIVKFSSTFLPRCFEKGKYQAIQQLQDPRSIKPGYFVRVSAIARPNLGSQSHGLYLNADMVELNFVGEEIVFGRDAGAAFGAQQAAYVPQGAMQLGAMPMGVPGAGAPMGNPTMGGMVPGVAVGAPGQSSVPAAGGMPQTAMAGVPGVAGNPMGNVSPAVAAPAATMPGVMAGGNVATPHGMPGTAVQPNAGFVQGAMQAAGVPQPGMMPTPGVPQPQAQPVLQPTAKAQGYTVDQFLQNGFNIDQLINEGYFVRVG